MPRVYLAGPDVFLPRPWERGAQLKAICARHGLDGVFPLDGSAPADAVPPAAVISAANEAHIRGCDAVLANLTPFRGPSADSGTVYEIGFARALGLPVVGYSNDPRPYEQRCRTDDPRAVYDGAGWRDGEGLLIEEFGLPENLMIACGIEAGGGRVILCEASPQARWADLSGVDRAARALAALLSGTSAAATG